MAVLSDVGEFVVVHSESLDGYDPYYRPIRSDVIGPQGARSWGFEVTNCSYLDGEYYHTCPGPGAGLAASPSARRFLVVWDDHKYYNEFDVVAQSWTAEGLAGALWEVGAGQNPAVAVAANGEHVVAWEKNTPGILARRLAADGSPLSETFEVTAATPTAPPGHPVVAFDSETGDFLIAWEHRESSGTDTDGWSIQARRFASDATPLTYDFQVNTYVTGDQRYPAISPLASGGGFLVVWSSGGSDGTDSDGTSIQGRRVVSNVPVARDFQINSYTTGDQSDPELAVDPGSGNFLVGWMSTASAGSDTDGTSIQARYFGAHGLPIAEQFQVNAYTTLSQLGVGVAASPGTREFVVAFRDTEAVRAQRLAARPPMIFADGFEAGDHASWSGVRGGPGCVAYRELNCIDQRWDSWNNGGAGSTVVVDAYPCLTGSPAGPEVAYAFVAPADGTYTATLTGLEAYLGLAVLQGGACDPAACIESSGGAVRPSVSVPFFASAGETVMIVVDGYPGQISDFMLEIRCP